MKLNRVKMLHLLADLQYVWLGMIEELTDEKKFAHASVIAIKCYNAFYVVAQFSIVFKIFSQINIVKMARKRHNQKPVLSVKSRVYRSKQLKKIIAETTEDVLEEIVCDETTHHQISSSSEQTTLKELIRCWTNCHGITTRAVNDLLKILISKGS